jgi:hypothetical protein
VLPVLQTGHISRPEIIAKLAATFAVMRNRVVIADWPEDIVHTALLTVTGPGWRMPSKPAGLRRHAFGLGSTVVWLETPTNIIRVAAGARAETMSGIAAPTAKQPADANAD